MKKVSPWMLIEIASCLSNNWKNCVCSSNERGLRFSCLARAVYCLLTVLSCCSLKVLWAARQHGPRSGGAERAPVGGPVGLLGPLSPLSQDILFPLFFLPPAFSADVTFQLLPRGTQVNSRLQEKAFSSRTCLGHFYCDSTVGHCTALKDLKLSC